MAGFGIERLRADDVDQEGATPPGGRRHGSRQILLGVGDGLASPGVNPDDEQALIGQGNPGGCGVAHQEVRRGREPHPKTITAVP